ncbi:hypothetical protein [Angustibacter aerolatus]
MKETPLDVDRTYVEFVDPGGADDDEQQVFRCDLTWLTSSWTCVFGSGCKGIYADRPDDGCCTLGAHFTEQSDVDNVTRAVALLTPETWQLHPDAQTDGWTEEEDGDTKTRVVDGACIFLNRKGFAGGYGCAFHHEAARQGVAFHTLKPEVCWQLPLRRTYRQVERPDGSEYLETTIGEYDRRGWGPGGHDLDWYCSGNPEAHVGAVPVFRGSEGELRDLMGDAAYELLARHCEAHLELVAAARGTAAGRRLLPLLVHPATLKAEQKAERRAARRG